MRYQEVIHFWFKTLTPKQWWIKDSDLDARVSEQFLTTHYQATQGQLKPWRVTDQGRLAEIIVLDQFSRNIFRGQPQAFLHDQRALDLTNEAVEQWAHTRLEQDRTNFLLLPYMHSESLDVHRLAEPLFLKYASESTQAFEIKHRDIIERFGRYPHRNKTLGRESTAEEIAFLCQPGSGF